MAASPRESFNHPGPDPVTRKPRTDDKGAIHASGVRGQSAGCYVVTGNGDLVLVPPNSFGELKPGQRLATQADIDAKIAAEIERSKPAPAIAPSSSATAAEHAPGEHDVK